MNQEERIYRLLFDRSIQGMALRQGEHLVLVNQRFADMVGFSIAELLDFSPDELLVIVHPEDRPAFRTRVQRIIQHEDISGQYEYRFLRRDGTTGWWVATISAITYQDQPAFLATYIDVSDRKQAEENAHQLARALRKRARELECLYELGQIVETPEIELNEIMERIVRQIPLALEYPEVAQVCITLPHAMFSTPGYQVVPCSMAREIRVNDQPFGMLEVGYQHILPGMDTDCFSPEENVLITAIAERLGRIIERQLAVTILHDTLAREQLLADLLRSSSLAMVVGYPDGRIGLINTAYEELTGYSEQELRSLTWAVDLTPAEWRAPEAAHLLEMIEAHRPVRYEKEYIRKDGTRVPIELIVHPRYDAEGKIESYFAFVTDITERKRAEQERLTFRLEQARMNILTEFITQASHEFRTPLSTINTNIYMLRKVSEPDQQSTHLHNIEEQSAAIGNLVNALLAMLRLSSESELRHEDLDVRQLAEKAYFLYGSLMESKHVQGQLSLPPYPLMVRGHVHYLQQAIECLIDNAVRFTPPGGLVHLHVAMDALADHAVIEVKDTGPGISQEDQPHIFERFYRADKAGTTRGFGLGLPIAKTIIERHAGTITFVTAPNVGSTFQIRLPSV